MVKRIGVWAVTFLLVVGGGIATFWDVDFWRLFDANQQPLAMTETEAWCAGSWGMKHNFRVRDSSVAECIKITDNKGTEPNVGKTTAWTCTGIISAGWNGTRSACVEIIENNNMWIMLTGGFTTEWNQAHPRPKPQGGEILDAPPTRGSNRSTGIVPGLGDGAE